MCRVLTAQVIFSFVAVSEAAVCTYILIWKGAIKFAVSFYNSFWIRPPKSDICDLLPIYTPKSRYYDNNADIQFWNSEVSGNFEAYLTDKNIHKLGCTEESKKKKNSRHQSALDYKTAAL